MEKLIKIEPNFLEFKLNVDNRRQSLTITNNSTDYVDLELNIKTNTGEIFKIPSLRSDKLSNSSKSLNSSHSGIVPLNPQEHQLFYVIYEPQQQPPSNQISSSTVGHSHLELKYKDCNGIPNLIQVPLIIS